MKVFQISDKNKEIYSKLLKAFEANFTYPLGDKSFIIRHGDSRDQYFDFFEALGKPSSLIVTQSNQLIGTVCAVLRGVTNINEQRFWYLCDFKLAPSARGKKVLLFMLLKYFVKHYIKCPNLLAINMSPIEGNRLINKLQRHFFFLKLKVAPLYFYQWSLSSYRKLLSKQPSLFSDFVLLSNERTKELVIDGRSQAIYHLVNKQHYKTNLPSHQAVNICQIKLDQGAVPPLIMLATNDLSQLNKLKNAKQKSAYQGSIIYSKNIDLKQLNISSLEV